MLSQRKLMSWSVVNGLNSSMSSFTCPVNTENFESSSRARTASASSRGVPQRGSLWSIVLMSESASFFSIGAERCVNRSYVTALLSSRARIRDASSSSPRSALSR